MIVNFLADRLIHEGSSAKHSALPLDRVAVIVLAGGEGKRLEPLTHFRCKPALPFGGRFTLIDVPISHALSSGLSTVFVIGQYMVTTLQRHLSQSYYNYGIAQNQLQMLVPEERDGKRIWYEGTADAIRQNLNYFSEVSADYFLILSGDQLYNINFQEMIRFGVESQADLVIAAQPVAEKEAMRMGILKMEHGGSRLLDFHEKPKEHEILRDFQTSAESLYRRGFDAENGKNYLGSMGIYLFRRQALFDLLRDDPRDDFGKHLIVTQMRKGAAHVFLYDGYWEDIGTIDSYFHANLALTRSGDDRKTGFQLYDEHHPIFTKSITLPSAKILGTTVQESLVAEGSQLAAKEVVRSVVGMRSIIGKNTVIHDSVLMGNDYYHLGDIEGQEQCRHPAIGDNSFIARAIIDQNVSIGSHVRLINEKRHMHYTSREGTPSLYVRDGIIIVPRGARIPDNFIF